MSCHLSDSPLSVASFRKPRKAARVREPQIEQLLRHLPDLTLSRAVVALLRLVDDPLFLASHLQPLLAPTCPLSEITVVRAFGTQEHGAALQIFLWPPHTASAIHDHACWGAIRCAVGALHEERYQRMDDGAQPHTAHLRKVWQRVWRRVDGVTTVLPYEGGIHRISNPSDEVALSVHLYGPRLALCDGRDYDTRRDYVCDRYEPEPTAGGGKMR